MMLPKLLKTLVTTMPSALNLKLPLMLNLKLPLMLNLKLPLMPQTPKFCLEALQRYASPGAQYQFLSSFLPSLPSADIGSYTGS